MNPVQPDPIALRVNIGGQLSPTEAIGRDPVVREMFGYLDRGMNLVINDPRRIGKSVVLALLAAAETKKVKVAVTSVQPVRTTEGFMLHLVSVMHSHQSLSRRARKRISGFIETTSVQTEVEGVPFAISIKTRHSHKTSLQLLGEVFDAVHDALDDDEILVLAVDEFTEAVINIAGAENGRDNATELLQTLQTLRKRCTRIRWVLTGSIGMHHAVSWTDCTAAVISGDCKNIQVGPLTLHDAEYLSRCLALGERIELTDEAHVFLADQVDGIAILIHAIIDDLRKNAPGGPIELERVDQAITAYIEDNDESRAFEHFVSRLQTYYPDPELTIARSMLDRTATRSKPIKTAKLIEHAGKKTDAEHEVIRTVLTMLVDDHYLVGSNGRISWRYPVLARVWRTKRGLGS